MERKRGTIIAVVAALVIAVVSLGIAFAAFSTTLNINGTATVQSSKWDIFFTSAASGGTKPSSSTALPSANITESNTSGYPETVTDPSASIVATTLTWSVKFKTPGDRVRIKFYVKNGGDFNAKVDAISLPTLSCTGGANQTQANALPDTAKRQYYYGIYTNDGGTTALNTGRALDAGATDTLYLVAWLDDTGWASDGTGLPSSAVSTAQISATITYKQATSN